VGSYNGNVLSQAIQPLNMTQAYTYDSYNRLLGAAESGGSWTQNYVYDGRGTGRWDRTVTFRSV
jgi:hypothetical protein